MVDLNVDIYNLLKGICQVSPEFPTTKDSFPVITYTEVTNVENYGVDGVELISD